MNKTKVLAYLKLCLHALITGAIIGAVVGLYQLGIQGLSGLSGKMYASSEWWMVALIVVLGILGAYANNKILDFAPGVDGSGIPSIELGIRKKRAISWKKDIPMMILNSYISTFVGFPLGSEGPSVVVAGKLSKMTEDISRIEDDDAIAMACGTGFGCAFLSPLAGLCYIFEESLHKFHPALIFRSLIMMASAIVTTSLINHHHLLEVENVAVLGLNQVYVLFILVVFNVIVGVLFVKAIIALKRYFTRNADKKWVKYRGYALFAVVILLSCLLPGIMGAGSSLVKALSGYQVLWIVILILLLRFFMTVISGSGRVTGGLVVPMMTLGALTGQIACLLCNRYFGLPDEVNEIVILISMCMIFGIITKTPFTSVALVYSAFAYSGNDYLHAAVMIPFVAVAIFLAVYISKWMKVDCLYEQFMEISLEFDKKPENDVK